MNTPCHSYLAVGLAVLALAACQQAPQVPEASSAAAQPTVGGSLAAAEPAQQTTDASSAAVPDDPRITTEQEFREKVVGKRVTNKSGYAILQEDGTITGAFGKGGKDKVTGTWTWEGQYYCRTVKLGSNDPGYDCQVIEVSGDVLTSTRKKGKGKSSVWKIEPGS